MQKLKIKSFSAISILILCLFIITSMIFFGLTPSYYADALYEEVPQSYEHFYLDVVNREGRNVIIDSNHKLDDDEAITVQGYTPYSFIFQWKDIEKFVLNYDAEKSSIPPQQVNIEDELEVYKLLIEIEYFPAYYKDITTSWNNLNTTRIKLFETTEKGAINDESYKNLKGSIEFNIDKGTTGEYNGLPVQVNSWGIYRFRYTINNKNETFSDFFIIEPTTEIFGDAPKVTYTTYSSQQGLHNAYTFSLKNEEVYRYIDQSRLVWYVLGQSSEGTSFCLTYEDIDSGKKEFENCANALFSTATRTGQTFRFDTDIEGEWKVWCEYQNPTGSILKSNTQKVHTGQAISFTIVIWLLVSVVVLSITVTIAICAWKSHREKIY